MDSFGEKLRVMRLATRLRMDNDPGSVDQCQGDRFLAGAISKECGNEPEGNCLKGNHKGWFIRIIPLCLADQQDAIVPTPMMVDSFSWEDRATLINSRVKVEKPCKATNL